MQGAETIQNTDMAGIMDLGMDLITTWGLKVVGAIALLIIGRMIAGILRRIARKALENAEVDPTLVPFLSKLAYYFVLIVVVIAVLGVFGVQTASLVAVLGAAGLAVGLALQGTLSNFAAGVMLLFFRPFKLGDFIDAGGTTGSVEEIGVFATTLKSPDNVKIVVPNKQIYDTTISNYQGYDTRRIDLVHDSDQGLKLHCNTRLFRLVLLKLVDGQRLTRVDGYNAVFTTKILQLLFLSQDLGLHIGRPLIEE